MPAMRLAASQRVVLNPLSFSDSLWTCCDTSTVSSVARRGRGHALHHQVFGWSVHANASVEERGDERTTATTTTIIITDSDYYHTLQCHTHTHAHTTHALTHTRTHAHTHTRTHAHTTHAHTTHSLILPTYMRFCASQGHSDAMGGALIVPGEETAAQMRSDRTAVGSNPGSLEVNSNRQYPFRNRVMDVGVGGGRAK